MEFQTYLKDCDCKNQGIIIYEGKAVCRWCRTPYGKGGQISYEPEHFNKESKPIQDKDWEIVSIKGNYNGSIYHNIGGMWLDERRNGFPHDCSKGMEGSGCEIHSVRRKKDNAIFAIDYVTNYGIIESFNIGNDGWMNVHFTDGCGATLNSIEHETKPKVPLFFLNEVNIYEGDTFYSVNKEGFSLLKWTAFKSSPHQWSYPELEYFCSEEKAKEYIWQNKKQLVSFKEIDDYFKKIFKVNYYPPNHLKQFFKLKINNG